jgi:hypothetical protein
MSLTEFRREIGEKTKKEKRKESSMNKATAKKKTRAKAIRIDGKEHVPEAFMRTLRKALRDPKMPHELERVVISPDSLEDVAMGHYYGDLKIIVLHLPRMFRKTMFDLTGHLNGLSIMAGCWMNLHSTAFHEIHHASAHHTDKELFKRDTEALEDTAQEYAVEKTMEMALSGKLEMPPTKDMGYFAEEMMKFAEQVEKDDAEPEIKQWVEMQLKLMKENLVSAHEEVNSIKDHAEAMQKVQEEIIKLETDTDKPKEDTLEIKKMDPFVGGNVEALPETGQAEVVGPEPEEMTPMEAEAFIDGADLEDMVNATPSEEQIPTMLDGVPVEHFSSGGGFQPIEDTTSGGVAAQTNVSEQKKEAPVNNLVMKCRALYVALSKHMFERCGFSGGNFMNPKAVVNEPIRITDQDLLKTFVKCRTHVGNGQWNWVPIEGGIIRGELFVNDTVPGYDLMTNDGRIMRILAQNPAKASRWAYSAQQGNRITWVIDNVANKWVGRIVNEQYEPLT